MVLKIAHRGASGYEPENTLRSFEKAISLGAEMIECDAHLTKDNQVVIIHDQKLNRTTNGRGKVVKKTLAEIKKLDAGKGEKMPTLEEVIDLIRGRCKLNIEVKGWKPALKVAEIVHQKGFDPYTIISSSNYKALKLIRNLNPNLNLAYELALITFRPMTSRTLLKKIKQAGIKAIHINKKLATKRKIAFLHKNNLQVRVWIVNKPKQIKKFKELGVDGIISDYPNRI